MLVSVTFIYDKFVWLCDNDETTMFSVRNADTIICFSAGLWKILLAFLVVYIQHLFTFSIISYYEFLLSMIYHEILVKLLYDAMKFLSIII